MEFPTELFKHISFSPDIPEGYNYAFEISIFHQKKHLALQGNKFYSFFIMHDKKKAILGHVHFHLQEKIAHSPLKASFGGIECYTSLDAGIIWHFIDYFEEQLKKLGVIEIQMIYPPLYHDLSAFSKISDILNKKQYQIFKWETGACIEVSDKPFQNLLEYNKKRRFTKGKNLGYKENKPPLTELSSIYKFIASCRLNKNQHISLSLEQLQLIVNQLPENFHLFTVKDGDRIISASISILIKPDIIYNFYQAHDADYDKDSPVLLLSDFIYRYCQQHAITTVDLGTSALEDKPNFLLLHFKERIGSILSPKFGFRKSLS